MSEFFRKPIVKTLMLKGQEGQSIKDIIKTGTDVLVDTYTIEFNDGTMSTFTVTNGKGISNISKTGTSGLVDTYTIEYNDGTTSTFTVTNGDSAYKPAVEALGKRIDNLILSSGTESSAEVVDARNGYDGTTYDTLGTAIRNQISELKSDLDNLDSSEKMYLSGETMDKYIQNLGGSLIEKSASGWSYSKIKIEDYMLNISCNIIQKMPSSAAIFFGFIDEDNNLLSKNNNVIGVQKSIIPKEASYIILNFFGDDYCGSYTVEIDPFVRKSYVDNKFLLYNQWYGKKGVAFGTSLTYRAKTTGGYLQYLPNLSGITFDNQGVGSSKIYGSAESSILNKVLNYQNYADKDVVLIEGFVNDWYNNSPLGDIYDTDDTTVCGCLYTAINHILTVKDDITIVVILDHFGINANDVDMSASRSKNVGRQFDYYEKLSDVCALYGIPCIKEYKTARMNQNTSRYYLDYIHLNPVGAEQSANAIWSELKNIIPSV